MKVLAFILLAACSKTNDQCEAAMCYTSIGMAHEYIVCRSRTAINLLNCTVNRDHYDEISNVSNIVAIPCPR